MICRRPFDCANLEFFISKLRHYGVKGHVLLWIQSNLVNRKQSVTVNNSEQSQYSPSSAGVPSGTVLGLFLYLVYANGLPKIVPNSKMITHADDTTSIGNHPTQSGLLQILEADNTHEFLV